ncbi:MAG: YhbY family RNA-binding protein [Candidatus Methanofastidiosia archaeon]
MKNEKRKELMEVLSKETASVIIGKSGLSKPVFEEMRNQLKRKKAIKISIPSSTEDRFKLAEEICQQLRAEIVDLRGRKLIIFKR